MSGAAVSGVRPSVVRRHRCERRGRHPHPGTASLRDRIRSAPLRACDVPAGRRDRTLSASDIDPTKQSEPSCKRGVTRFTCYDAMIVMTAVWRDRNRGEWFGSAETAARKACVRSRIRRHKLAGNAGDMLPNTDWIKHWLGHDARRAGNASLRRVRFDVARGWLPFSRRICLIRGPRPHPAGRRGRAGS